MWARLLHVALAAPAAALLAGLSGPVARAQAPDRPPAPIVVAIDPGHGGSANPHNPSQLFDPGCIGVNGVEEKDVTLDVGKRLASLLGRDDVRAVLTRTTDEYLTIAQREQTAIGSRAAFFVSIHVNSFRDPSVGGSLVLYPNAAALPFAQTLSDALGRELRQDAVADSGVQLRDNWWIHAPMPTSTVEMAYLTNPHEAALMATGGFRQQVAAAIRDGIEAFDPQIATRRAEIGAWRARHPSAPAAPTRRAHRGMVAAPLEPARSILPTVVFWMTVVCAILVVLRWPRVAIWLVVTMITLLMRMLQRAFIHRRALRRRRRALARQAGRPVRQHSVYDELWL
jgi:N-acetylmuramoyl-L-alanine amidase